MDFICDDVLLCIFSFLNISTNTFIRQTCKKWARLIKHSTLDINRLVYNTNLIQWNLDTAPMISDVLHAVYNCKNISREDHISCIDYVVPYNINNDYTLLDKNAIRNDHLGCLKYANTDMNIVQCCDAARNRSFSCMKYIYDNRDKWVKSFYTVTVDSIMHAACIGNDIRCIKYLHSSGVKLQFDDCVQVALNGNAEALKYFYDNGCFVNPILTLVSGEAGSLECLKYLHSIGVEWHNNISETVGGNLECLKYVCENGAILTSAAYTRAAKYGNLECLKYLCELKIPYDDILVMSLCASSGSLECLKYMREQGCEYDEFLVETIIQYDRIDMLQYIYDDGYKFTKKNAISAIILNDRYIKFLHERGCPMPPTLHRVAAIKGSMRCLRYIHENNICTFDTNAFTYAVLSNNMETIRYLHEIKCPWDADICTRAKSIEALKFLHESGCSWDGRTIINAIYMRALDMIQYACENGCKYDEDVYAVAKEIDYTDALVYLDSIGCPRDDRVNVGYHDMIRSNEIFENMMQIINNARHE